LLQLFQLQRCRNRRKPYRRYRLALRRRYRLSQLPFGLEVIEN